MKVKKSIECKLSKKDEEFYDKFIEFLKKEYPLKNDIEIRFMGSRLEEMTTGARTDNHVLKILVKGRMNRDVLRTLAHEWIHEYQRTILKRDKQKNIGSKNENEANAGAGEILKKFEEKYPKLENSMYESIIRKILKEEFEMSSDFDWIKDTPDFEPGKYFDDDDMCYNTNGSECKVNINGDEIIFFLDYEDWRDKISEGFGDSDHIVEPLLSNPNYDGHGDYYEFDSEEFNYAGHHMTPEQKVRLQNIVNLFSPDVNIEDYMGDYLNDLTLHLTNKEIKGYWDALTYKYLDIIGYQIQENRWKSIGEYYKDVTLRGQNVYKIPVQFKLIGSRWGGEDIQITVSTEDLVNLMYEKNENNLSSALDMVSSVVTRPNWYDYFFEDWDTSGSEYDIKDAFDRFLDNSETYIEENSDEFTEQLEFYKMLKKLGFVNRSRSNDMWVKNMWVISNIDFQEGKLRLEKKETDNIWSPTRDENVFVIDFEDLPVYLSQYRMDI